MKLTLTTAEKSGDIIEIIQNGNALRSAEQKNSAATQCIRRHALAFPLGNPDLIDLCDTRTTYTTRTCLAMAHRELGKPSFFTADMRRTRPHPKKTWPVPRCTDCPDSNGNWTQDDGASLGRLYDSSRDSGRFDFCISIQQVIHCHRNIETTTASRASFRISGSVIAKP